MVWEIALGIMLAEVLSVLAFGVFSVILALFK